MREPYISFTISGLVVVWMMWAFITGDVKNIVNTDNKEQVATQAEPEINAPHMQTKHEWPIVFQKTNIQSILNPDFTSIVFPSRQFALGGTVTPSASTSIDMGDINGDGTPDFVMLLFDDSVEGKYYEKINVLLSDAVRKGEFSPSKTVIRLEGQHHGLILADVNGDAYADILILSQVRDSEQAYGLFSILLADNEKSGTFKPVQNFTTDGLPVQIAVAEMNGDGKPDIVISLMQRSFDKNDNFLMGFNSKIGILFSDATQKSGFSPFKAVFKSKHLNTFTLNDLNGDQIADIVAVTSVVGSNQGNSSGLINILYSDKNKPGKFSPAMKYFSKHLSPLITKIKSHDMNGDGYVDLVVLGGIHIVGGHAAFPISYSIDIFLAKPTKEGGFLPPIRLGENVKSVKKTGAIFSKVVFFDFDIADLNHDGYAEIITSSITDIYPGGVIYVYSGNPLRPDKRQAPFQFSGEVTSSMSTGGYVFVGELTGDDKLDIVMSRGGAGDDKISILTGSSTSVINFDTVEHLTLNDPRDLEIVDMNNDGNKDIVVANGLGGVDLLFSDPKKGGSFFIKETLPIPALSIYTHDLNKDGSVDIIAIDSKAKARDTITIAIADSSHLGGFLPATRYVIKGLRYSTHLRIADLNKDGLPDIIPLNSFGGKILVLWGDKGRPGEFLPAQDLLGNITGSDVRIGDLNNDDKLDLMVLNCNTVSIYLSYNSKYGLFSKVQDIEADEECGTGFLIDTKDVNADGQLDLIIKSEQTFVALADPLVSGHFMPLQALNLGGKNKGGRINLVEDLNLDCKPDIVREHQDKLTIFLSDSKAKKGYVEAYSFILNNEMSFSGFEDINGDGKLDILLAGYDSVTFALADPKTKGKFLKQQTYSVGSSPLMGLYFHDLNHDGKSDLIMIYNDI